MRFGKLFLVAVLAGVLTGISWPGTNKGEPADIIATVYATDTTGTVTSPMQVLGCGPVPNDTAYDNAQKGIACRPVAGTQHIIRSITYQTYAALGTGIGQCTYCIAEQNNYSDSNWQASHCLSWSTTDVGNATTPTCDTELDTGDGDIDGVVEYCINKPPTPLVVGAGSQYVVLVDEVSAGSCDLAKIMIHIDRDIVELGK